VKRKLKVDATHNRTVRVRVNPAELVRDAIERGVKYGWHRAHKHNEAPTPESIQNEISERVIDAIYEVLEFPPFEEEK
jgi:hypothetical protein